MTTHNEPSIARRPFLRGAGVTLAALGGMTGVAAAKGSGKGVRRLADLPADILVYWSLVDSDENDPNEPENFGYMGPLHPAPPGGLLMGHHDPAGGGMFDFSRIKMMPGGDRLQNKWLLMGGTVMATGPRPYDLVHVGGGKYQSTGQEMTFLARPEDQIERLLGLPELPPALAMLAGSRWHAVGLEFAQLGLDADDDPDPSSPEWGATRIDFYEQRSMNYGLSLLYVLGADDTPHPADGIPPEAWGAGHSLIAGGRLSPSVR